MSIDTFDRMYGEIKQSIADLVAADDHLVKSYIALSGGVDSMVILHACAALKNEFPLQYEFEAIHVHHGLSQNADSWADFCKQMGTNLNIKVHIEKVDMGKTLSSIESRAREARYAAIATHAQGSNLILGHHRDDLLEGVLLQLMRGAGPTGLASLSKETEGHGMRKLRPMLDYDKNQIQLMARMIGLDWVEDDSNDDSKFDRNYLRNQVIPLLKLRWPEATTVTATSSQLMHERNNAYEKLLCSEADKYIQGDRIEIEAFTHHALPPIDILLHWMRCNGTYRYTGRQLKEVIRLSQGQDHTGRGLVRMNGCIIRRKNKHLTIEPHSY